MDSPQRWNERLGPIKGFMFDLDGTLVLSDRSSAAIACCPAPWRP